LQQSYGFPLEKVKTMVMLVEEWAEGEGRRRGLHAARPTRIHRTTKVGYRTKTRACSVGSQHLTPSCVPGITKARSAAVQKGETRGS
jgi:hypothetical protein